MDWTEDQLAHIGEAQDCRIAVEIGGGFPKRTTVWIVRCGDALYVRPYFGAESRWYNAALDANRGEVDADGETFGVTFALAHNHPGGDPTPTDADRAATLRVTDAAAHVGLRFLDHVVVTDASWRSVSASR